jgi:hypothetical protein
MAAQARKVALRATDSRARLPPHKSSDGLTEQLTLTSPSVYNISVSAPHPQDEAEHRHHRHAVYASETTGLLLIALVLLVLTLIRYWHEIHWSLR